MSWLLFDHFIMSTFQLSAVASPDDIEGTFRTSLRSSRSSPLSRNDSRDKSAGTSRSFPAVYNTESIDSRRTSSTKDQKRRGHSSRRSRSIEPRKSRSYTNIFPSLDYDASLHNDTPMVSRYNHRGEVYAPVSYAWDSFRERLFDSSLNEKYEVMRVQDAPRNHRRFRSMSPNTLEEEDEQDDARTLLFLQDPVARAMYRNLETYFDRKTVVRTMTDGFNGFSARGTLHSSGSNHARAHTSMGFNPSSSFTSRSEPDDRLLENLNRGPPQSSRNSRTSHSPVSLLGRRKRESAHAVVKIDMEPDEVKREIEQRFARINFDEGTTDYDALFTISDEMATKLDEKALQISEAEKLAREHNDLSLEASGSTPKFRLDHLRF